jgi:cysteinyl-tRNA synthetase
MLAVKGRKMSKSDGNFITVRDLLAEHPGRGEAVRMALMSAHYRQPLDFTRRKVAEAVDTLDRLYSALRGPAVPPGDAAGLDSGVGAALLDDLNTPLALARLHGLAGLVHAAADGEARARACGGPSANAFAIR